MLHRTVKNLFYELGEQHNIKFCEANSDFISPLKVEKDRLGCKPLWLFFKDGAEVARIEGADVPKIISKIERQNTTLTLEAIFLSFQSKSGVGPNDRSGSPSNPASRVIFRVLRLLYLTSRKMNETSTLTPGSGEKSFLALGVGSVRKKRELVGHCVNYKKKKLNIHPRMGLPGPKR
jgi:hypothetical protein